MNTPMPLQPVEAPELTAAQQALTDFERAFVFSGTRAEFHRAAQLILPFVSHISYECLVTDVCECADLEVWYVRQGGISWFYSVCHAHRLQPLGRAVRAARAVDPDRAHRARRSGYTTERWHASRGL